MEFPVFINARDTMDEIAEPNIARDSTQSGTMLQDVASPEHSTEKENLDPDEAGRLPLRALVLLGCVFGAIHCLAWNSSFPTSQERLAWRICALATVAIPGLIFLALMNVFRIIMCISIFCDVGAFFTGNLVQIIYHLVVLAYILARITLIILAFLGLRALPASTFRTLDWDKYFPHFAN